MPSDTAALTGNLTGQCYCGAVRVKASAAPFTTAYCHCSDCRRISGAPVSALAAFAPDSLLWTPALGVGVSHSAGVRRWFCTSCGSPLVARYEYLPDQSYVPIGLFDDASSLAPQSHSHAGSALSWLHLRDDLPKSTGSGRGRLNDASDQND